MKRWILVMCISISAVCLLACTQGADVYETECSTSENLVAQKNDIKYLRELEAEPQNIVWGDIEDTQAYMSTIVEHSLAVYNGGYYYAATEGTSSMFLSFFDPQTGLCTPVCSQPQCEHMSPTCTALYDGYNRQVWCYNEKLYFIKTSVNGKAVLTMSELDGTGRKELFEIGNSSATVEVIYNLCFMDNCVYIYSRRGNCGYLPDDLMEISVRLRSLDGKIDKNIVVSNETNSRLEMLKGYRGNLFFVYAHSQMQMNPYINKTTSDGLFCYNMKNDEVIKVVDAQVCDFAIDDTNNILYYYVIGEGLYRYSFNSQETKKIYTADDLTTMCMLSYDGKYIYMDNVRHRAFTVMGTDDTERYVYVLDSDGRMINTIRVTEYGSFVDYGDNKYLLLAGSNNDKDKFADGKRYFHRMDAIHYIDKSSIQTATEWKQSIWND